MSDPSVPKVAHQDRQAIEGQLSASALEVAPRLLGATLLSDLDGLQVAVRITEVEAYEGATDPASHAYRGRTRRTAVMFGPAGHLYCYFVYGMHWCANVVVGIDGVAAAVLLRAGEIVTGVDIARARAGKQGALAKADALASGPARLARALGLRGEHSGLDLLAPQSPVRLVALDPPAGHLCGPRVGVSVGGELPWRFWIADEPSVSTFRSGSANRRRSTRQTVLRDED